MGYGVMAAQRPLESFVWVRVLVAQQKLKTTVQYGGFSFIWIGGRNGNAPALNTGEP